MFSEDTTEINYLIDFYKDIEQVPWIKRFNDKLILKDILGLVFLELTKSGKGQAEQINIVLELFELMEFEDYKHGWSQERFDRIRKGYYEPNLESIRQNIGDFSNVL